MRRVILLLALMALAVAGVHLSDKIKHIVVLMEENRSFDHLMGWYGKGVDGLNGTEFNYRNVSNPSSEKVFVNNKAPYINYCDPNHGTPATTYKIFGPEAAADGKRNHPTMEGFAMYEYDFDHSSKFCGVLDMFDTRTKLPVLSALADEFVTFDRFFASVPGPTWPNRQFFMSGTSNGLTETIPWYKLVPGSLFPQKTIFDQVAEANGTWAVYYQDTPWELFMESLAHNPQNLRPLDEFFDAAAAGTLPTFSFINPRAGINITTGVGSNDEHPDHDVALAEAYYKQIYEALRASPSWNDTLFVLTYDEHGGFYDHVPPPMGVPPPTPGQTSYPDKFSFDRLGIRIPTLLISPWVQKGRIVSAPPEAQKPFNNSEYDLTSIIASSRKILKVLNDTGPLTQRDAWVATWEHLLDELDEPRTDCPMTLPAAPPPSLSPKAEASMPINELQNHIMTVHGELAGHPYPKHIHQQGQFGHWAQARYQEHKERTLEWKKSKKTAPTEYEIQVRPYTARGSYHYELLVDTKGDKMTFHTHLHDIDYCLDAAGGQAGTTIVVSKCYPSYDPDKNRDRDQHWSLQPDATLRPYYNQTLCATNDYFRNNATKTDVYLAPCEKGRLDQHYAYMNQKNFQFGDNFVQVVLIPK